MLWFHVAFLFNREILQQEKLDVILVGQLTFYVDSFLYLQLWKGEDHKKQSFVDVLQNIYS